MISVPAAKVVEDVVAGAWLSDAKRKSPTAASSASESLADALRASR
jgi:hypothetical protein